MSKVTARSKVASRLEILLWKMPERIQDTTRWSYTGHT
jgi:hypothetical protein